MGLKSTQLWPESKRRIPRRLFWWGIFVSGQHVRFCRGRKISKWKKMVSLESFGPSQNYNLPWDLNWLTWSRKNSMDAVCALHHISTSGLLGLGYIVIYIYMFTYVYIYIYIFIYLFTHVHIILYIYNCYHYIIIYIYTIIYNVYVFTWLCMYIYIHTTMYIYIYTVMYCIYAPIYIYSAKSNERGWLYRYVCWQLSFYGCAAAECVGDGCCLCPASHLNKRLACIGLHSYVCIYVYIYICVYIYIYLFI